jgi:hypothetical protein
MNVAVCVKQIPDTASPFALDPEDYTLVREGRLIMDDSDSYGVEMGLQMREVYRGFTNLDSPPEGRLCRPDYLSVHLVAQGGGREGACPLPANGSCRR